MLLHDLLIESAKTFPDRPALFKGDQRLDYSDFLAEVIAAKQQLAELGIGPGDRVAVFLNKRVETVSAYFAISMAGAVFVPINPVLKAPQIGHILRDCDVRFLVTGTPQLAAIRDELSACPHLESVIVVDHKELNATEALRQPVVPYQAKLKSGIEELRTARRIDNDMAAILYTSGSTGLPKGVVLSHRNLVSGALDVSKYIGNEPDDVILAALPFSFDAGFSQLTTAIARGASVVLLDYLLPRDVPRAIARYGVTGLTGVPPLWNQLAKIDWPDEARRSLRYIANTGGAMPSTTLETLRQKLPNAKTFLMYGLTEAFRSTYLPPEETERRPTSIGKAIPNAEILVVRDDGSPCAPGETGELVHRGALVALGYWNDPERTRQRFRPAPGQDPALPFPEIAVWSGDRVMSDEEGFLYFVGRMDDMIKSSGYRISPTELEEVIYKTGCVVECAAIGVPHKEIGQAVVVVAQGKNPGDDASKEILDSCRKELPIYMIPNRVIWKDALPKNPNGKIDRRQLAADNSELFSEEPTE